MPDVGGIAGDRLKSFVERIERLQEEKKALLTDIKEVYAEAKGTGFDPKIMRQVIRLRAMDKDDLDEQEALKDVYMRALGMLPLEEAAERDDPVTPAAEVQRHAKEQVKKSRVRRAANRLLDGMANKSGQSVEITVNGKGVKISNKGGKKTVEPVGAQA